MSTKLHFSGGKYAGQDFSVEIDTKKNLFYYTPMTQRAKRWTLGLDDPSGEQVKPPLIGTPKHGQSFMFNEARGAKLRGYLNGLGYSTHTVGK